MRYQKALFEALHRKVVQCFFVRPFGLGILIQMLVNRAMRNEIPSLLRRITKQLGCANRLFAELERIFVAAGGIINNR